MIEQLYAALMQETLLALGHTSQSLAEATGIPVEHIEKGILSSAEREQLDEISGIEILSDPALVEEMKEYGRQMFDCYVALEPMQIYKTWQKISARCHEYRSSLAFLQAALNELIFEVNIGYDEDNIHDLAQLLRRHFSCLDEYEQIYYHLTMARWFVFRDDHRAALHELEQASKLEKRLFNPRLKAVIQHVRSVNHVETGYAFRGYVDALSSLAYFKNTTMFYRQMALHSKLACAMMILGMDEEPMEMYRDLLERSQRIYPEFTSILYDELARGYFARERYDQCLLNVENALEIGSDNPKMILYKMFCLYKLNRHKELCEYIAAESDHPVHPFTRGLMKLFLLALNGQNEEFQALAGQLLIQGQELEDLERQRMVLDLLLEAAQKSGDLARENHLLRLMMENQRRRVSAA